MRSPPSVTLNMDILLLQECHLCHQQVKAELQLPLSAILIEGFGMCPNCYQRVTRQMEDSYEYRARWLRWVSGITKKKRLGMGIQARGRVQSKVERTALPLLLNRPFGQRCLGVGNENSPSFRKICIGDYVCVVAFRFAPRAAADLYRPHRDGGAIS